VKPALFALQADEQLLGSWPVAYVPPCGDRYSGRLWVTDQRLVYEGLADVPRLQRNVAGAVTSVTVAYALDLDAECVAYGDGRLSFFIPKSRLDCVAASQHFLGQGASVTIKDNGSIHIFETGWRPAADLLQALRQQCPAH
jgi:hypothetical protein